MIWMIHWWFCFRCRCSRISSIWWHWSVIVLFESLAQLGWWDTFNCVDSFCCRMCYSPAVMVPVIVNAQCYITAEKIVSVTNTLTVITSTGQTYCCMNTSCCWKFPFTLLLCFNVLGANRQSTTHKKPLNDMSGGFPIWKSFCEKTTTCIWFRVSGKVWHRKGLIGKDWRTFAYTVQNSISPLVRLPVHLLYWQLCPSCGSWSIKTDVQRLLWVASVWIIVSDTDVIFLCCASVYEGLYSQICCDAQSSRLNRVAAPGCVVWSCRRADCPAQTSCRSQPVAATAKAWAASCCSLASRSKAQASWLLSHSHPCQTQTY